LVGGTYHKGDFDETVNPNHTKKILERAATFCPEVLNAPILKISVGFRPYRKYVRIEKEFVPVQLSSNPRVKKNICVVHNYGQGGAGVTVHWGCAGDAVKLLIDHLQTKKLNYIEPDLLSNSLMSMRTNSHMSSESPSKISNSSEALSTTNRNDQGSEAQLVNYSNTNLTSNKRIHKKLLKSRL
jgi:hypothetical protein